MEPKPYHCWLDKIIREQAKHYGLSVPQLSSLMSDAAKCQEILENQNEDTPNEPI